MRFNPDCAVGIVARVEKLEDSLSITVDTCDKHTTGIADISRRVHVLEEAVKANTAEHTVILKSLQNLATQAELTASNTAEIVVFFNGIRFLRSAILFGAPFVSFLLSFIAFSLWVKGVPH